MSRKRQGTGGDQLTGGTRDVNPQFLNGAFALSAANTYTSTTIGTPIVRVGSANANKGTSIIMEILKIFVNLPPIDLDNAAATDRNAAITFATTAIATGDATLDNPRVFMQVQHNTRNAFTAAGTGILAEDFDPVVVDLTDGAGHGILVATDNIFVSAVTTNQTAASTFRWKILYRFKEVSLVEYIGIVQSQQ